MIRLGLKRFQHWAGPCWDQHGNRNIRFWPDMVRRVVSFGKKWARTVGLSGIAKNTPAPTFSIQIAHGARQFADCLPALRQRQRVGTGMSSGRRSRSPGSDIASTRSRGTRAVGPHVAECHRGESREACRPHGGCALGDHTIAGRSNWRVLSLSRRLLLGAGSESQPRRNNSEHGNQKQRRDRASHGTPPSTLAINVTTEGAARQCGLVHLMPSGTK